MASLETRIADLAQAIGTDVKSLNTRLGTLANLTTTEKTNLVGALNEVLAAVNAVDLTDLINDSALSTSTTTTYSVSKILAVVEALRSDIMGGIPASTLDTIKELADYLAGSGIAGGIVEQLGLRVRVDAAQSFTAPQQTQGRSNIAAAAALDLSNLVTAIGNTDRVFATDYATAKA